MPHSSYLTSRLALLVIPVAIAAAAMSAVSTAAASPPKRAHPASGYVRLLVKLRPHSSPRALRRTLRALGARREGTLRHLRVVVVRVPRRNAAALVSRLARARAVKHVERNHVSMRITDAGLRSGHADRSPLGHAMGCCAHGGTHGLGGRQGLRERRRGRSRHRSRSLPARPSGRARSRVRLRQQGRRPERRQRTRDGHRRNRCRPRGQRPRRSRLLSQVLGDAREGRQRRGTGRATSTSPPESPGRSTTART